jgi:hypothetical protein
VTTCGTAGIVAFGAWISRWKLQDLSRQQLLGLIAEQKAFIEDKDRVLANFREELARVNARCDESTKRQTEMDEQILEMVRQRHLRERWIRQVMKVCEGAGVTLPPWEES